MQTAQNAEVLGVHDGNGHKTDTGPASSQDANMEPDTTGQETGRGQATSQDVGTSEVTAGESTTSKQETAREDATNQEGGTSEVTTGESTTINQEATRGHATNQEGNTPEMTARESSTTNQEPAREHATNQEGITSEMTAGESSTTNQEITSEQTSSQDGGTSQETAGEPGSTNQEIHGEHATNPESDTTDVTAGEPGTTDQEPGDDGRRTDTDQETTSSEHQMEELASIEQSPDPTELDTSPEEELKVIDGADMSPDTAGYQETPSEPREELEDTQDPLEALENGDTTPQEEHEQWGRDIEHQDSSTEDEQVREDLIQQYQALVLEKEKVQQRNSQLQNKLYEYFRRKKGDDTRPEMEKHVADQEQRYLKYLAMLGDMRKKFQEDTILHEQQINKLRAQCQDIVIEVDKEWAAFLEQKKKIALYVVNRGAGKHAASSYTQEVLQFQAKEERKEKEVIQVRLENIKLKNQINHHESTLRSKEELAEGLHLIDFEQLKIENQTYNEKIEERNEELLKLRKKITNTVQVLTHLKEKLQYVQNENQEQKGRLKEVEVLVAHKRDILTRTKQARDSLRMDNLNLKQKCGLLGNKTLLRDFEEKVDATEELSQKLENLKRRHAELMLSSKGVMKKIEDTKIVMES